MQRDQSVTFKEAGRAAYLIRKTCDECGERIMEIGIGLLTLYIGYCVAVMAGIWLLSLLPMLIALLFDLLGAALDRVRVAIFRQTLPPAYHLLPRQSRTMPSLKPGVFRDPVGAARAQWERESAHMNGQLCEMALRVLGLRPGFTRTEFVAAYKAAMAEAQRRGSVADQDAITKAREVILAAHEFGEGV